MSDGDKFESLLPKKDVDLSSYRDALNYAMNNDEIRNIALSGSYGSGKSSVIRSYEGHDGKEKKFLHISLAHFEEEIKEKARESSLKESETIEEKKKPDQNNNKGEKTAQAQTRDIVNLLEGKIVNQLLHQIDPKKIRQSKFHVKTDGDRSGKIRTACFFTVFAFLLFYSIGFNLWKNFVMTIPKTPLALWSISPRTRIDAILLCFILGGIALYSAMRSYGILKMFKKIDVKGVVGVEVFEAPDDLYFDKYLNEVLYLFEHSGADAIVFEDLDRYEVIQIFEKLKEISDLLYLHKQQRKAWTSVKLLGKSAKRLQREPLVYPKFFYLIRDDVFTSSNRSKFFDFMIPVVPVVATGNACDLLEERLSQTEGEEKFNRKFLRTVSLYLPDLRLINNIVNEYTIFSNALGKSALNREQNNQLAIIIYKNIFPRDFERLQHGDGYVYGMLRKKKSLIMERQRELEEKREEIRQRQERAHEETLKSVDELNALFLPYSSDVYAIDGDRVDEDWSRVELVKRILSAQHINRYPRGNYEVSTLFQEMKSNPEYQARKKSIEDGEEGQKNKLDKKIKKIDADIRLLNTRRLCEVLTDKDSVWQLDGTFSDVTSNPAFDLLKYLIWNGYIDEDYSIYVSFFYPNSLTVQDRNFLLSVSSRKLLGDDYKLDAPQMVLDWLDESSFSRKEVENLSLFEYLLEKKEERYLVAWMHSLDSKYDRDGTEYTFAVKLWKGTRFPEYLVKLINRTEPHWFRDWTELGSLLSDAEWQQYAVATILYSSPEVLQRVNKKNWLTCEISDRKNFLQINAPQIDKLINGFKALKVRFKDISYRKEDIPLVKRVYEENLYELNPVMLELWLSVFYGAPRGESLKKSYSYLMARSDEPLSRRVEENLKEYLEIIFGQTEYRFEDEQEAAVALLGHEGISEDLAETYIHRLNTTIRTLELVGNKALWPVLLDDDVIPPSSKNLLSYYAEFCADNQALDAHFVGMLKRKADKITWKWAEIVESLGDEEAALFLEKLINCTELSVEQYRLALQTMRARLDPFEIRGLPEEYAATVIQLGFVKVSETNLAFIRSYYPNHVIRFLMQNNGANAVELVEQPENDLNGEEIRGMLGSEGLQNDNAIRLIKACDKPISIKNLKCADAICAMIVENYFEVSDINWILVEYEKLGALTQQAFLKTVKLHKRDLYSAVKGEEKIPEAVYVAVIQILEAEELRSLRKYLPNAGFEAVCTTNQKPKFPGTEENRAILDYFEKQGWISSYQKLPDGRYQAFSTQKKLAGA